MLRHAAFKLNGMQYRILYFVSVDADTDADYGLDTGKRDNTKIDFQIPTQIFLAYLKLFVHLTLNLEL